MVVVALILSDVLLALLVWQVAAGLQSIWGQGGLSGVAIASIAPNVLIWVGLRALLGLYPGYGVDQVEELRRQTYAVSATLAITAVFALAAQVGGSLSRLLLVLNFLGLLLLAPLARNLVKRTLLRAGVWGKPVVILGAQEVGAQLLRTLQREWPLGLRPVEVFDNHRVPEGGMLEGVRYGGRLEESMKVARDRGIDTAIFAMPHTRREHLAPLVSAASTSFRCVVVMPNLGGITNSAVTARDFAGSFGVEIKHNLLDPWSRRTKRVLDLLTTVAGALLISPLLLAVVVLVRLDSPGPAFYGHLRLGAGGRHFRCWKFRTMHTDAERLLDEYLQGNPELRAEWEKSFKLRNDPRVTRVGRFLRKTSLDELPQLWNVLRGEMSLVGPRPIVDAETSRYGAVYDMYRRTRPGISGLWQVSGRSDTGYRERIELDAYYVHNWSVWLDVVILVRTVRMVLLGRGAY
ncbi:MAG: undecaprenyl-phosphate galactose phosphotransferase WbaP [Rubrobacter sp.]|nr:undecaprenyl-phosphate galactose phosphotransferase WbaP [Rubrobacter sp.]